MRNKTLVVLALALICFANADNTQNDDFEGPDCDKNTPCPSSHPVCNFDDGDSGFCEQCPGHSRGCLETGYVNPKAIAICCDLCPEDGGDFCP